MTAPARSRTTASRASTTEREQSAKTKQPAKGKRTRSAAAERAYARREARRERSLREAPERRPSRQRQSAEQRRPRRVALAAAMLPERVAGSRLPLVVVSMSLLATGLVATLWLSIAAVSGSYRLQQGEAELTALNEQKERLMLDVNARNSTPALQRAAAAEGLVPAPQAAHLVTNPDGTVSVIGDPQAAEAPAPPPVQASPAPPQAGQPPAAPPQQAGHDPRQQAALVPAVEGR
ncbi:hypothetical protein GCM10009533_09830 [Saccharopolyspora spinosporotrichia]|uniref:Cell division protein FtsL n=1 Tax=Saccharopolyspora erythraea TaxID=1836 RepID=A0ABP3M497_SACER